MSWSFFFWMMTVTMRITKLIVIFHIFAISCTLDDSWFLHNYVPILLVLDDDDDDEDYEIDWDFLCNILFPWCKIKILDFFTTMSQFFKHFWQDLCEDDDTLKMPVKITAIISLFPPWACTVHISSINHRLQPFCAKLSALWLIQPPRPLPSLQLLIWNNQGCVLCIQSWGFRICIQTYWIQNP